jgi:hypothetical protein
MCLPAEDISSDESLLLWKDKLGIKEYIPLPAATHGVKIFEFVSSTGYTWSFIVSSGGEVLLQPSLY